MCNQITFLYSSNKHSDVMQLYFNEKIDKFAKNSIIHKSSVQFSCSVMSNSFRPHEPQHAKPPCPWLTPGVHPNPRPLSRGCHPTISSSVVPFSSCPQSFPASGSFPMSPALHIRWPKYWSFSFTISPSNEHPGLISFRMDESYRILNSNRSQWSVSPIPVYNKWMWG